MGTSNIEEKVASIIQQVVLAAYDLNIQEKEVALQKVPLDKAAFGDYQCNAAMGLAKRTGSNPREVAAKLVAGLTAHTSGLFVEPEVAGPGFINLKFTREFVNRELKAVLTDTSRLGISPKSADGKTIVDFSSPNVAKEMHVGHLRSTIIGDTIKRHLEFLGHDVLGLNHVGDCASLYHPHLVYICAVAGSDTSLRCGLASGFRGYSIWYAHILHAGGRARGTGRCRQCGSW
jgi:arginyl-tRNA synthetase